ncbi:MAG TPA: membrane protein insertion efficiency factor YidD [Candidatus Acidoferrum sp.]|nr:membrane protein insertion efficiency factor YidD [Candidatus Acidoferrum sp.]
MNKRAQSPGSWVLLAFVRFYIVFLSPFFGGACKFYPSCSNYAREAIAMHGARRGMALAAKRLLRCRPFTKGGFDPVPEPEEYGGSPRWRDSADTWPAFLPDTRPQPPKGRKL